MKKHLLKLSAFIVLLLVAESSTNAQVKISTDNNPPDNSAMLDVMSTNKGLLAPRMTYVQRNAIANPAEGLIVICTNGSSSGNPVISVYLTGKWLSLSSLCETPSNPATGTHISTCTQITWNWNSVPISLGYKWNIINDYVSATDMGTNTTQIETGLTYNTAYTRYVCAYNGCGYSASTTLTQSTPPWSCGCSITDSRDSKTYNTVLIGSQCWFAQNLNVGTKVAGSVNQANNSIIEKYCYDNNDANCNTYGGLYQWDEAMQYSTTPGVKGICPTGWHLPTDAEWTTLTTFLGGEAIAGGKMKEAGTTHWSSPNTNATNSSGFTALPGGYLNNFQEFTVLTYNAAICSSTEYASPYFWNRNLPYNGENVSRDGSYKSDGFSVRCVQD
ncbi:MAG: hypothetical protein NTU98_11410 [Bacteroidetes bacterium]|nr:hypothetical protein [Bacteroidota bacterium]